MLDRKSQGFDLQEVRVSNQAIDINALSMSGQLAVQTGTQAPKGVGKVLLDGKLASQLTIDRFNQLADGVMQMFVGIRNLLLLVRTRNSSQTNAVLFPQLSSLGCTDVGFVSQHLQIVMLAQQFKAGIQIRAICRGQLKIEDQAAHRDQQLQAIAEERLLFGHRLAVGGRICLPICGRIRHQVKLHHRNRQTIQNALPIPAQIQAAQEDLPNQIDCMHQILAATVETTLRRNSRKQVPIVFPATQQFSFHMPAATFSDQAHGNQLAIRAFGFRPRPFTERRNRFPNVIYYYKDPGAKIIEIRYHQVVLRLISLSCGDPILIILEDFSSINLN